MTRLDACGADAELVALAQSCLAAGAEGPAARCGCGRRPALTAYLAGVEQRLKEAGLAQARAEARAAGERKRALLAVALAASVLATGLLGAGGWVWVSRERLRRRGGWARMSTAALDDAVEKRDQARGRPAIDPDPLGRGDRGRPPGRGAAARGARRATELRDRVRTSLAAVEREQSRGRGGREGPPHGRAARRRSTTTWASINDWQKADAEYAAAFRAYGVDSTRSTRTKPARSWPPARSRPSWPTRWTSGPFCARAWLRNSAGSETPGRGRQGGRP